MNYLDNFCFVDFETTGLDPGTDNIVEIGALRGLHGKGGSMDMLVQLPVGRVLPAEAAKVNNLTTAIIQSHGMHPEHALNALDSFVNSSIVVAHNAGYDVALWDQHQRRFGLGAFTKTFLCTKTLAMDLLPGLKSYSLQKLYIDPKVGMKFQGQVASHRALGDCRMTACLLRALLELPHAQDAVVRLLNCCGRGAAHHAPKCYLPHHAREIDQFTDGKQ